ncbi:hypothetical protein ACLKA7_008014 [Drosophila subpalustris]
MSEDLDELFLSPIPGPTPVELQQCILFGFRRRLYPSQILEECRSAFGPFAPSGQYVAKWYQRFQDGLFAIDEHDEEWCGQTPTTCSDYNDEDNDNEYQNQNQNDSDNDTLPLVLRDVGQPSDKDSYSHDEFKDGYDDDDDDDDEHVISYWQGYGYLGGKRSGMSISGLPPLPKSLSGFNKLLGSDSGLLSDVDAHQEHESNNNNSNNKENECGNKLASQKVSDNKNNNSDKQISKENANDKSESVKTTKATTTMTAATVTSNANENENNTKATTTTAAATTTSTATTAAAITTTATTLTSSPAKINVTGSTLDAQIATLRKEMVS